MKCKLTLVLSVAIAALGSPVTAVDGPQKLDGQVLGADGAPAAGAIVWAAPLPHANSLPQFTRVETTCDEDGKFKLALGPGAWYVWARKEAQSGEVHVGHQPLIIRDDMEPIPVRIEMQERAWLRVQLLEAETQKPLVGAKLWIDNGLVLTTDAHGRAEAGGLTRTNHEAFLVSPGRVRQRILFDTTGQLENHLQLLIPRGGTLKGRVTDVNGQPIPGAYVERRTSGSYFSISGLCEPCGPDGSFVWHGPTFDRPGQLTASAPDFVADGKDVLASMGNGTVELKFKLNHKDDANAKEVTPPPRSVKGTIKDVNGRPVAGVGVGWRDGDFPVVTNAEGRFTIDDVPGHFVWLRLNSLGRIPVFPPIPAKGHQNVQVTITEGHTAGGVVVDETGAALAGVSMMPVLRHHGPGDQQSLNVWQQPIKTDANGRFRMTQLPENCWVRCNLEGHESVEQPIQKMDQLDNQIRLKTDGGIRGRVIDHQGQPVRNFRILLDSPRIVQPNQPGGGWFAGYCGIGVSFTNDEGKFTLTGMTSGSSMRVIVVAPDYLEGTADPVIAKPVKQLAQGDEFTVQLVSPTQLSVTVVDDNKKPITGARVALLRGSHHDSSQNFNWGYDDASWADEVRGRTAKDGTATFAPLTMNNAIVLVNVPKMGRQLVQWSGEPKVLTVIAQPEAIIKGRVLDMKGMPRANTYVRIAYLDKGTTISASTDRDGRFEVAELPPGKVQLTSGATVIIGQLTLTSGETVTQEWRMPDETRGPGLNIGGVKKK